MMDGVVIRVASRLINWFLTACILFFSYFFVTMTIMLMVIQKSCPAEYYETTVQIVESLEGFYAYAYVERVLMNVVNDGHCN